MLVIVCNKCTTTAKNIRHYLLALVIPPISSTDWQVILPRLMLCNVSVFSYHSQCKRTQVLQVSLPILTWFVLHSRCAQAHSQSNAHKTQTFVPFFLFFLQTFLLPSTLIRSMWGFYWEEYASILYNFHSL